MTWLQAAILGALVWAILRTTRFASPAERFQVWFLYLAAILIVPAMPLAETGAFRIVVSSSVASAAAAASPGPVLHGWVTAALVLWLAFKQFAVWGIWRRSVGTGRVRHSDEILSPAACAWGILLPLDAMQWPEVRLSHVIRHEQAHIDRRDVWFDLFASVLVAFWWQQPFAWLALWQMRRDRELAADDLAIQSGSNTFEYAETIHQCAEDSTLQPAMAGGGHGHLEERMLHLLHSNAPRRRANWLTVILATLALSSLVLLMPRISAAQSVKPAKEYDVAPKVIHKFEPKYTDSARDRKISGTVILSVRIDTDGQARDTKVLRPLDAGLDLEAQKAVEGWTFEPAKKEGVYIAVRATIEVNFRLE